MPSVGFEPTTPVFERANAFHALDRAATVVGILGIEYHKSTDGNTALQLSQVLIIHVLLCSDMRQCSVVG
jgi:hypothetical protein